MCSRIIGYQYTSPDGMYRHENIDSVYVDGITVTHGSPRQHIWTLYAGLDAVSLIIILQALLGQTISVTSLTLQTEIG